MAAAPRAGIRAAKQSERGLAMPRDKGEAGGVATGFPTWYWLLEV